MWWREQRVFFDVWSWTAERWGTAGRRTIVQYHMHCALYLHQIVFPQQEFSDPFAIMTTLSYSFSFVFARCDVSKVDDNFLSLSCLFTASRRDECLSAQRFHLRVAAPSFSLTQLPRAAHKRFSRQLGIANEHLQCVRTAQVAWSCRSDNKMHDPVLYASAWRSERVHHACKSFRRPAIHGLTECILRCWLDSVEVLDLTIEYTCTRTRRKDALFGPLKPIKTLKLSYTKYYHFCNECSLIFKKRNLYRCYCGKVILNLNIFRTEMSLEFMFQS